MAEEESDRSENFRSSGSLPRERHAHGSAEPRHGVLGQKLRRERGGRQQARNRAGADPAPAAGHGTWMRKRSREERMAGQVKREEKGESKKGDKRGRKEERRQIKREGQEAETESP